MKTQILERASASVAAVDGLLTHIDRLNDNAKDLESSVEASKQSESEILESDAPESKKVAALLKSRAELDVRSANLAKIRNEIGALQAELRPVGDKVQLFLGALID